MNVRLNHEISFTDRCAGALISPGAASSARRRADKQPKSFTFSNDDTAVKLAVRNGPGPDAADAVVRAMQAYGRTHCCAHMAGPCARDGYEPGRR